MIGFVMILKTQLAQKIQHVEHEGNIVKKNAWLRDVFFFDLFIFLFYSTMRQIEQLKKQTTEIKALATWSTTCARLPAGRHNITDFELISDVCVIKR